MKNKNYIHDSKKHDVKKIKRCLYTPDGVREVNNPISAVTVVDMPGELTLDQQVRRIMQRTLAKKMAQAEINSVEDISEAWDFDMDEPVEKTPFEFASEALDVQHLKSEPEIIEIDEDLEPEPSPSKDVLNEPPPDKEEPEDKSANSGAS